MKTSTIIYVIITAVVAYLAYKAYSNYQLSGSVFSSEEDVDRSGSRFGSTIFSRNYLSTRQRAQACISSPNCSWVTDAAGGNGRCVCGGSTSTGPSRV